MKTHMHTDTCPHTIVRHYSQQLKHGHSSSLCPQVTGRTAVWLCNGILSKFEVMMDGYTLKRGWTLKILCWMEAASHKRPCTV